MPSNQTGSEAARVRCLYCGANNFPGTPVCWQCQRPLQAARTGSAEAGPVPMQSGAGPSFSSSPLSPAGSAAAIRPPRTDLSLAPKAAAALGMMFPYIGLPVGVIFLMLDDPRKTQLGWMTIGWSLLGGVLNSIAFTVLLIPVWAVLKELLPHGGSAAPSGIPGLPNVSGDGTGLLFPWPLFPWHQVVHFLTFHV